MKRFAMLCFAFGLLATRAVAADAGLPEYIDNFAGRAAKAGAYAPLERATAVQQTRVRAFGFGGAESHYSFAGESSPVRFKSGQPVEFVVRVAAQDQDPQTFVQFYSLKAGNGERILPMVNVGAFAIRSGDTSHAQAVVFDAAKYGTNFFKIAPSQPLSPGEYSLSTAGTNNSFLFGVDP
jgi:hypothetical protein